MKPLYFPPINKLGNVSFRRVCLNSGAQFVFTEMIRAEKYLENDDYQRKKAVIPIDMKNKTIVQIICENPETIEKTVDELVRENSDIFEINYNMGCPQSTLCKKECGGAIVGNTQKVRDVARKLSKVCKKYNITASIKIRLAITRDNITIYKNARAIYQEGIKKLYIHGRALKDTYNKPATYEEIAKTKQLFPNMEIIANGDVKDLDSLNRIITQTDCDGVLIGRAALENPYIFKELKGKFKVVDKSGIEIDERQEMILEFLKYAKEDNLDISFAKCNLAYLTRNTKKGGEFRKKINDCKSYEEIIKEVERI